MFLSPCFGNQFFPGLEDGSTVCLNDSVGVVVYVVGTFGIMVPYDECAETTQVDIVSVGHVGLDGVDEFADDEGASLVADACAGMDFFYYIRFSHWKGCVNSLLLVVGYPAD